MKKLDARLERHSSLVALAGDHAKIRTISWRATATAVYLWSMVAIALALLIFLPQHFDLRLQTLLSVLIVALFLIAMERPVNTSVTMVAPLTAICAASAVVLGAWVIVLMAVAWLAVRFNLRNGEPRWRNVLSAVTAAQISIAIIVAYASLALWHSALRIEHLLPPFLHNFATFLGIIVVGLGNQTVNNLFAYPYYAIRGQPFSLSQLLRSGTVASIYAYLLVAAYSFGGILATSVFYVIVAQIRVVQDVLGVTALGHKLERVQEQARGLVKDMIHLTDADNVEFASEVQNIAQMLGSRIGMSKKDLEALSFAAELHEMGKSRIPARIRNGKALTSKEAAQRQTYSRWGALMIRAADALLPAQLADLVEFHSEHFDGTGYPRGLKGESIPLGSRIIAVSRDYVRYLTGYDGAPVLDKEKALQLLREGSGTLYDPKIVKLLFDLVS